MSSGQKATYRKRTQKSMSMGHSECGTPVADGGDTITNTDIVMKGAWGVGTPFGPFLLHDLIESSPYSSL